MAVLSSRYTYEGTEATETSITRVGGALDPTGSPQSRKIFTTANAQWLRPFKAESYAQWNVATDGNVTATVYGLVRTNSLPLNDDIWMEVSHLKASGGVLGAIVNTTKANVLANGAAVAADSSTWNNAANVGSLTTFDAATATVALSNGNLTATYGGSGYCGARSIAYANTGKYYFEVTVVQHTNISSSRDCCGIVLASGTYSDMCLSGNNCVEVMYWSGAIFANNVTAPKSVPVVLAGDVVSVAVDFDSRLAWFRVNGGNWNNEVTTLQNPATSSGGISFPAGSFAPAVGFNWLANDRQTINFGQSAYAYTPPAGFYNWSFIYWTPFKLTATLDLNATAPIAAVPTTWDPATATAVTLSGGNLVVTSTTTSGDQGAHGLASSVGKTTGKYYFEVTVTTVGGGVNTGLGVATTASTYTAMGNNATAGAQVYVNGSIYANSLNTGLSVEAPTAGKVMGIAVDLDNRTAWFRNLSSVAPVIGSGWNGNNDGTRDPANNTGGVTVPAGTIIPFCTFNASGNVFTANFGASAFTGAVPSGFTSGWPAPATPDYHAPVGYIEARVRAAKPSAIYYIDPTVVLSPTTPTAGATAAYKTARYGYEGTETTEASVVRTNGAQDPTGIRQSRRIVTTANSQWLRPFKAEPYAQWSDVTGANVIVTLYGAALSTAVSNDDVWMDVEYLGATAPIASTSATWDPATATAVTLSSGNLIATNTGTTSTDQGARAPSTVGQTAGKYYFEVTLTDIQVGGNGGFGIGTPASTYTNMGNGGTTGVNWYWNGGNIWTMGGNSGSSTGLASDGYIIGAAFDLDNRRAWYRIAPSGNWNGSGTANPATNVGGVTIPAGTMIPFITFGGTGGLVGNIIATNFGASAFTGAVPSGFTSGWPPAPPVPASWLGKIVTTTKANVLASGAAVATDSSAWDSVVAARLNSRPYVVGDAIKVTSNVGRTFVCTSAGTSAATEASTTVNPMTWSTTDARNVTYTAANMAITGNTVNCIARTLSGQGTGKFYFENTWTGTGMNFSNGSNAGVGIAIINVPLTGGPYSIYGNGGGACLFWSGGTVIYDANTSPGINLGGCSLGSIICVAVDMEGKRIWFKRDAGLWNAGISGADPVTGVGGINISSLFTGVAAFATATPSGAGGPTTATLNVGASAFAYTPPSGFVGGPAAPGYAAAVDGSLVQDGTAAFRALNRFKLTTTLATPQPGLAGYIHTRVRAARPGMTYYIDPQINSS